MPLRIMLEKYFDIRSIHSFLLNANFFQIIYCVINNKGKSNPRVELGSNLLITNDYNGIIMDYKVTGKKKDVDQVQPLFELLKSRYPLLLIFSQSETRNLKTGRIGIG